MSVLIRGMDMPYSCSVCPMCRMWDDCLECRVAKEPTFTGKYDERMPDCPLVEVKAPHGRLIDADEMISLWKGCTFEGDITCLLGPRPTVLEPEE